jgi:primary-amine oxidase
VRPIVHRAALSEMVVPYGTAHAQHYWKNAFDAGEWGMGRMVTPLSLGCDCLGEIHYFDAVLANERGDAFTVDNAICLHEEDHGIGWKHRDLHTGTSETRRSRRLVISSIYTVGNYEYAFYWYLYLDGTIELEVKLTGIVQPIGVEGLDGDELAEVLAHATLVAPGIAAPHHQHLFCVRLDMTVDGDANTVTENDVVPAAAGPANPHHNAFVTEVTPLRTEQQAQRLIDPSRSRTWHITNPHVTNALGRPVAYKLLPQSTPTLLAGASSRVAGRAQFATRNLWVTPYAEGERFAAGRYPSQSAGGGGLPAYTAGDRSIEDADVVVWHTFGVTHIVRPEDWPVMPVESIGFSLIPTGFFDRNPALDVPPTTAAGSHCH